MARQTGPNFFTGRHGDLQYYQMGAGHYVRVVSSLSAKPGKTGSRFQPYHAVRRAARPGC